MLWVDVLNRALDWRDSDWLAQEPHTARAATLIRPEALPAIVHDVELLRRLYASVAVDATLSPEDTRTLSQWLAAVTVSVAPVSATTPRPRLHATRTRHAHPEPFESLLSSALVQLVGQLELSRADVLEHQDRGQRQHRDRADQDEADQHAAPHGRCLGKGARYPGGHGSALQQRGQHGDERHDGDADAGHGNEPIEARVHEIK